MSIQNKIQKGGITPFLYLERVIILKRIKKFIVGLIVITIINVLFVTVYAAPFEMQNAIKPNIQMYSNSSNNIIDTGKCGDNLTWTLYDDGLLSITGTGGMYYYNPNDTPWHSYRDKLKSLSLGNGITSIGLNAFNHCSGLTGNLIIPDSITSIGSHAFQSCSGLTGNLIIPDGVKTVGWGAFWGCSGLTGKVNISKNVSSIEYGPFAGTGITAINVADDNPDYRDIDGILFTKDGKTLIQCPTKKAINNYQFPDGVTTIGLYAFYNCSGLTGNIVIPDSVTYIGSDAFGNCSGLTGNLNIPDSVTFIGDYAFGDCRGLTGNLIIPDGVTYIGSAAFRYCDGLTGNIVIPDSVTTIGSAAFDCCRGITDVNIAKSKDKLSNYPWGLTGNGIVFHWNSPSGVACKINIQIPTVEWTGSEVTPDVVITDTER